MAIPTFDYFEVAREGTRTLFLVALPVVLSAAVAGTLISFLQAALSIQDSSAAYALRLLAVILVLYLMLPSFAQSLLMLAQLAFR